MRLAAAAAPQPAVELLHQRPYIPPAIADGVLVPRGLPAGKYRTPPAAGAEYRVAEPPEAVRGHVTLKEHHIPGPGVLRRFLCKTLLLQGKDPPPQSVQLNFS